MHRARPASGREDEGQPGLRESTKGNAAAEGGFLT
jgi:hypothetical protein